MEKKGKKQELDSKKKLEEYSDQLKRLQAEYENYVKRVEKEKLEFTKYASYKILSKLISLYDDFERAKQAISEENKELKKGIEMIHKNFSNLLEEEGIKKIEAKGQKFDPFKHEILDISVGEEDDLVLDEIQKGYLLYDKVLRTSKVKISKKQFQEVKENV